MFMEDVAGTGSSIGQVYECDLFLFLAYMLFIGQFLVSLNRNLGCRLPRLTSGEPVHRVKTLGDRELVVRLVQV
jgi:hypothetical protein